MDTVGWYFNTFIEPSLALPIFVLYLRRVSFNSSVWQNRSFDLIMVQFTHFLSIHFLNCIILLYLSGLWSYSVICYFSHIVFIVIFPSSPALWSCMDELQSKSFCMTSCENILAWTLGLLGRNCGSGVGLSFGICSLAFAPFSFESLFSLVCGSVPLACCPFSCSMGFFVHHFCATRHVSNIACFLIRSCSSLFMPLFSSHCFAMILYHIMWNKALLLSSLHTCFHQVVALLADLLVTHLHICDARFYDQHKSSFLL